MLLLDFAASQRDASVARRRSVDFDDAVDFSDEPEAGEEADGA